MPFDKRKLLGPLFVPLSRLKHGQLGRIAVATAWMPSHLLRAHYNRPYFAVNVGGSRGMGAVLSEALLMCQYAHTHGLVPRITSNNPLYTSAPNQNFLELYLGKPLTATTRRLRPMEYRTLWSFYHLNFSQQMAIETAHQLFRTYFAPKPIIEDKVAAALALIPQSQFDMAVHYRGTDKVLEAPLIDFTRYRDVMLDHVASGYPMRWVFLATDDPDFEVFIRRTFPDTHFTTYNLGSPIDASRGRHFSNMRTEDKAVEALVNIFLLAAAPTIIRGSSYMSGISKVINPTLCTTTLSRTRAGFNDFPEREILAEEAIRRLSDRTSSP